jgi:predicted adenylyl cyclase CyaB
MEIETKIFDIKKVRKVLEKKDIEPKRICDITDFFFRIGDFSADSWRYTLPEGKKSGLLGLGNISVEVPDTDLLMQIRDFAERGFARGSKIRLRTVDSVPYITIKWPKKTQKGIKSREEIETRIGSLSSMMQILLDSGAELDKSLGRIREIYHLPGYKNVELVIDSFQSAHGILEYAEIECSSEEELATVLKKVFKMDIADMSDEGITGLHDKKMETSVSRRIEALEELIED